MRSCPILVRKPVPDVTRVRVGGVHVAVAMAEREEDRAAAGDVRPPPTDVVRPAGVAQV